MVFIFKETELNYFFACFVRHLIKVKNFLFVCMSYIEICNLININNFQTKINNFAICIYHNLYLNNKNILMFFITLLDLRVGRGGGFKNPQLSLSHFFTNIKENNSSWSLYNITFYLSYT